MPAEQQAAVRRQHDDLPLQPGVRLPAAGRHHQPDPGAPSSRARWPVPTPIRHCAIRAARRRTRRRCAGRRTRTTPTAASNSGATPKARPTATTRARRTSPVRTACASATSSTGCVSSTRRSPPSNQLAYRFNQGVPNAVTYRLPTWSRNSITQLYGVFVQDQYTRGRLTLSGALRWDRASSYAPGRGQRRGRDVAAQRGADHHRARRQASTPTTTLSPRVGVAYDVFGNGRTALKLRWGKYLGFASNDPPYTSTNPAATLVATVTNRGWTDNDGDRVVDCDLLNPARQDPATAAVDICVAATGNSRQLRQRRRRRRSSIPKLLSGWGVRTHDYQTEVTLQQEVRAARVGGSQLHPPHVPWLHRHRTT